MTLNAHQKQMVAEATEVVARIFNSGGSLDQITQEEAGLLLDVMSLIEEHQQPDEGKKLLDLIDKHVTPDPEDD